MHYNANVNPQLTSVTDSYGRTLTFTYIFGKIDSITTPDGRVLTYSYDIENNLIHVGYPTSPATGQSYLYEVSRGQLTGIVDENGNRFASWTYAAYPDLRATSSQHAGGADLTTVAYDINFTGPATVTNPLGVQEVYRYTTFLAQHTVPSPICTEIDRLATATTAAAVRKFTYDSNGYYASQTDWNGNLTTFVNDAHGQPVTITEASGTPLARTTTAVWDPTFHLPKQIIDGSRSFSFTYDANGNLLSKTLTAPGLTSTQSYTYNGTGEVLTATGPPRRIRMTRLAS
jgi:YD repeat-containing protein